MTTIHSGTATNYPKRDTGSVPCPITDDCVFVDLETIPGRVKSGRSPVRALAGLYRDRELLVPGIHTGRQARKAMGQLAELARGARFVAGHNIVAHDRRFVEGSSVVSPARAAVGGYALSVSPG